MRKVRILIYIVLFILFSTPFFAAQGKYAKHNYIYSEKKDTVIQDVNRSLKSKLTRPLLRDSLYISDSVNMKADSLLSLGDSLSLITDSLKNDTVSQKKSVLDAVVDYQANDSLVMTGDNWAYLYGESNVLYNTEKPISLKAEQISMSMDSSIVKATFGRDSIGEEFGYPVFNDGGTDYESKTMRYNFKTQKGFSQTTITEQGDGHVVADNAKMNPDKTIYIKDGRYTTCDEHDHPHFYLNLTKAKVEPGKRIVTGPAYLVIEDLPLPFAIPFGFFPFSKKYSSGVIMPTIGTELERGYSLRDGGYYFAINDYIDLKLTGEIYTKGSWGLNAQSSYRKRYKYSGNFNLGYLVTKLGDKEIPRDYSVAKDVNLSWSHQQDPKKDMFRTLSASVNFRTSSYNRNSLSEIYNPASNTTTNASSTINLNQRIPNSPWSFNASASVNQNMRDSTIALTLPNMTVTMSRIYPFKRKEVAGDERWYEKIQLSYTGDFRNSINTKENRLFKSGISEWEHAMKHTIPVSATFNLFNYLNINPSFNYTERWYTNKIKKGWDPRTNSIAVIDTINKFNRVYDFSFSLGFQTKLYGFYKPLFGGDKIEAIRHVFTPSISLSYTPDFSAPRFGFYETLHYYDAAGREQYQKYSPYQNGMFGTAPSGKAGMINFNFENNVEMKVKSQSDTINGKKIISLIDNLGIGFSYNMMADSMKWSDINTSLRLKLSKSLTVNVNAVWDPYKYIRIPGADGNPENDRLQKVDRMRISHGGGFGRLMRTGFSISPSINQDTFKKWFGKDGNKNSDTGNKANKTSDPNGGTGQGEGSEAGEERSSLFAKKKDDGEYDNDGYLKNEVKWNLSFNYSANYAYSSELEKNKNEYKRKLTHNFGLNGSLQPTKNWNFTFNTSYDFDRSKFAYMNCTLTRNLHCWSLSASFIPIGPYKSYYVSLRASSSLLQDLKYEKRGRSSTYDPDWGP